MKEKIILTLTIINTIAILILLKIFYYYEVNDGEILFLEGLNEKMEYVLERVEDSTDKSEEAIKFMEELEDYRHVKNKSKEIESKLNKFESNIFTS